MAADDLPSGATVPGERAGSGETGRPSPDDTLRGVLNAVLRACRTAGTNRSNWAFMRLFEIPAFDEPDVNYLSRGRLVQTPWFGVYLHRFDRPDSRPTLHDHPWPFASLVVGGKGYVERTGIDRDVHEVRRLNLKRATDLHYIETLLSPVVWTLVVVGRRRRTWGYVDGDDQRNVWTRFDRHPHAYEFDKAMAKRAGRA